MDGRFILVILMFSWALITYRTSSETMACDVGWFGSKCQYKCRCMSNKCNEHGLCTFGARCQKGWFGPECQYADLAYGKSHIWQLTDGDDTTCVSSISRPESVIVNLGRYYPFTWLRVRVKNSEFMNNFGIFFGRGQGLSCINPKNSSVDNKTLDIHCDLNETVQSVALTGEGIRYLCSIYISGGRNVALKQSTRQSSTYNEQSDKTGYSPTWYVSEKAVDGDTSPNFYREHSCSSTAPFLSIGKWSLIFSQPQRVTRYVIYNRKDTDVAGRIQGFTLQSFNERNIKIFDYRDHSLTVQSVYTVLPTGVHSPISHVDIKAEQQDHILTLCEVEVYGDSSCILGQYGRECEHKCNCAVNEACFISTGGCPSGCADGFEGEACDKPCLAGKYGRGCRFRCSEFCVAPSRTTLPSCYHINGVCLHGCKPGYQLPACTEACRPDRFGQDCKLTCSDLCIKISTHERSCDLIDGRCLHGCMSGYQGPNCSSTCEPDKYGRHCAETCSDFCAKRMDEQRSCDHVDGTCLHGCVSGYTEPTCVSACALGTYGQGCRSTCSEFCEHDESESRSCDPVSGTCFNGCVSGYQGATCNLSCEPEYYGQECRHVCSEFCSKSKDNERSCDLVNGTCLHGCVSGYEGEKCMMICEPGTHGPGCSFTCSEFCIKNTSDERSCDHTNGTCLGGCMSGYKEHDCLSICAPGYYGQNCTYACSEFCLVGQGTDRSCDHVNGTCLHGCMSGYEGEKCMTACKSGTYGPDCSLTCSEFCIKDTSDERSCDHTNGTCLLGCISGYREHDCLSACKPGMHGQDCKFTCSEFCITNDSSIRSCDHTDGRCLYGCVSGYEGLLCLSPCKPGAYGMGCTSICSDFCAENNNDERSCDHINGTCLQGCIVGYEEPLCMSSCEPNYYGQDCRQTCSKYCLKIEENTTSCDHVSGTCLHQCVSGYHGEKCIVVCEPDSYGQDCAQTCSKFCLKGENSERSCDHVNGTCIGGCVSGYQGDKCMMACEDDSYGQDCAQTCSKFCLKGENSERSCDHVNGTCISGCVSGYQGDKCMMACEPDSYGQDCAQTCSKFCLKEENSERSCDHVNGTCITGCVSGYQGDKCMMACKPHNYGQDCAQTCSEFCLLRENSERSCDHVNGTCLSGCVSGYQGGKCMMESPDYPRSSYTVLGVGIFVSVVVTAAAVIGIIFYRCGARKLTCAGESFPHFNDVHELDQYMELSSSDDAHELVQAVNKTTEKNSDQILSVSDISTLNHQPVTPLYSLLREHSDHNKDGDNSI